MSFTYSLPWSGARDYVRYLIADTVSGSAVFQDEELDGALAKWGGDARLAAAEAMESMARLYARNAISYSVTGFSLNRTQTYRALLEGAKALRDAALQEPFEFESVLDYFVDTAGVDRSNYENTPPDGTEPGGTDPIL